MVFKFVALKFAKQKAIAFNIVFPNLPVHGSSPSGIGEKAVVSGLRLQGLKPQLGYLLASQFTLD